MLVYDPDRDLYELLAMPADARADQIRDRIEALRGLKRDRDLEEAAGVLLDLELRTRYDTKRATYRMRMIMRESLAVFTGRAAAPGDPGRWASNSG
jgi:hypothetical protein